MSNSRDGRTLGIYLPHTYWAKLREIAPQYDRSINWLIKHAVEQAYFLPNDLSVIETTRASSRRARRYEVPGEEVVDAAA